MPESIPAVLARACHPRFVALSRTGVRSTTWIGAALHEPRKQRRRVRATPTGRAVAGGCRGTPLDLGPVTPTRVWGQRRADGRATGTLTPCGRHRYGVRAAR